MIFTKAPAAHESIIADEGDLHPVDKRVGKLGNYINNHYYPFIEESFL